MNDEFATEEGSGFGAVNGDVPVPEIVISDKSDGGTRERSVLKIFEFLKVFISIFRLVIYLTLLMRPVFFILVLFN
jgi:hypothetical protein